MMHADAHRSWSVRPLAETDLEAYLDIYLNSYPAWTGPVGTTIGKSTAGSCGRTPRRRQWGFSRGLTLSPP